MARYELAFPTRPLFHSAPPLVFSNLFFFFFFDFPPMMFDCWGDALKTQSIPTTEWAKSNILGLQKWSTKIAQTLDVPLPVNKNAPATASRKREGHFSTMSVKVKEQHNPAVALFWGEGRLPRNTDLNVIVRLGGLLISGAVCKKARFWVKHLYSPSRSVKKAQTKSCSKKFSAKMCGFLVSRWAVLGRPSFLFFFQIVHLFPLYWFAGFVMTLLNFDEELKIQCSTCSLAENIRVLLCHTYTQLKHALLDWQDCRLEQPLNLWPKQFVVSVSSLFLAGGGEV